MEKKERLGIYDDLSDSEGGDEYYDDYYSDEDGGASTIQNSRTRGSGSGSRYSGSQSYVEGSQRSRSQSQSQSRQSFSRKSGSILPGTEAGSLHIDLHTVRICMQTTYVAYVLYIFNCPSLE
jgi:hypothetical protein